MCIRDSVKRRKQHRGRMKGKALRGNKVTYGQYGMAAEEPCWITGNQIEAARVAINRHFRRGGTVWIKVFPDKPVSYTHLDVYKRQGQRSRETVSKEVYRYAN